MGLVWSSPPRFATDLTPHDLFRKTMWQHTGHVSSAS
jgi:hypothetical protein